MPSLATDLSLRLMPVALFSRIFCGTVVIVTITEHVTNDSNNYTNVRTAKTNNKQQMLKNNSVSTQLLLLISDGCICILVRPSKHC